MKKELSIKELCNLEYQDKGLVVPIGYASKKKLTFIDFKDNSGLFIAGATGTGKSILIDVLIVGLMYKNKPEDIKFIMLDPKKIELGEYDGISYLFNEKSQTKKETGYKLLIDLLKILEFRIKLLKITNHRNINGYNRDNKEKLPHIFVVVDEGSEIIKIKDSFTVFSKILDFGEYVGVHLIYATNDYLKKYSNSKFLDKFNYLLTFDLASLEQEKYINIAGANWLKGNGNALLKTKIGKIYKFQVPYITDEEIKDVVLKNQINSVYKVRSL